MLQNHATLREIRKHLHAELSEIYSRGETDSMVTLILEHCGYPSPEHILSPQYKPGTATLAQINEIVTEIHTCRPIQYILGQTNFCDLSIHIDENALIPRPETEEMVYRIISNLNKYPERIIDLGTGSGCIALALKKAFPRARVTGIDISLKALELAEINGQSNHLEVKWIQGDILTEKLPVSGEIFDLVVGNPPYVLNREKKDMDRHVLDFEPHTALFVEDDDPLIFYSSIARLSKDIIRSGGTIWLEINENFGPEVARLMTGSGFSRTKIHKDIHEKERFIEARI